ncbi:hypothetical protein KR018_010089 [Drosophila ironensis]|nr:hypothetical protein KR018_010089 [Drosophila ironensis]
MLPIANFLLQPNGALHPKALPRCTCSKPNEMSGEKSKSLDKENPLPKEYPPGLGAKEMRQLGQNRSRTKAQDRLKRLQAQLKRVPGPDKGTKNPRPPERQRSSQLRASSPPEVANSEQQQRRRSAPFEAPQVEPGEASAWEKPEALALACTSKPVKSANKRLLELQQSLQYLRRCKPSAEKNNNNENKGGGEAADDPEEMEWEDVIEPEPQPQPKPKSYEVQKIKEMRRGKELPGHRANHVYFVLDTNVLMDNISFLDDLVKAVVPGIEGSMLYIPYIVIKELDKLKLKGCDNGTKSSRAIRAIHYLNDKFDRSLDIQAQSAYSEAEHLIEINCPDDSIVNCCLQLKQKVMRMVLLTNDANLRLKAKANSIEVATRSQLLAKYPQAFAHLRA